MLTGSAPATEPLHRPGARCRVCLKLRQTIADREPRCPGAEQDVLAGPFLIWKSPIRSDLDIGMAVRSDTRELDSFMATMVPSRFPCRPKGPLRSLASASAWMHAPHG